MSLPAEAVAETAVGPRFFREDMPIEQLRRSPLNPRKHFDQAGLDELANSIRELGVIEPLIARQVDDHYEIVAGERRWRSAELAGLGSVPVIVKPLTDAQALEIMVVENNQRADVNALEESDGFSRLLAAGYDLDTLAARIGRSKKYIYDRIKLHDLVEPAKQLLVEDRLTPGHAILLARLKPADQVRAIDPDEGGLFFYDVVEDDEPPTPDPADPYRGTVAVPVREFDTWIDRHVRLDLAKPIPPEEFPAVAQAQETAARVVSITLEPFLRRDQEDGGSAAGDRILTSDEWRRADGTTEHPLHGRSITHDECPQSLLGVVVIGRERGAAFQVCVDRACDVHWKKERAEVRADRATESSATAQKRRDVEHQRWQAEQNREAATRAAYRIGAPAILAAFVARVKALKPSVLVLEVADGAALHPKALAAFPKPKTAEDLLRLFALSFVADGLFNEWSAPEQVPLWAKRFGLDLKPLLKPAKTAVHTSAQKASTRKIAPQPKPKKKKGKR